MSVDNSIGAKGKASRPLRSFAVMFLTLFFLMSAGTAVFAGKSTLGDFVWIDYNRNGLPDDGPTGINGVVVNVYKDDGNGTFSPVLDSLVAISTTINEPANVDGDNTAPGERGYYDVPVNDGNHWVHLPASNFAPGGPLEGYTYTGSGQVLPDGSIVLFQNVPIQGDIDTADFGFVLIDWGDLPDDDATAGDDSPNSPGYSTNITGTVGASHVITPGLRIGPSVDAETNGQPNATATGDDNARTPDDESGVTLPPMFAAGKTATFTVTVVNTTGVPATLYGFVDWNGDGDFLDSVEKLTVVIPSNAGGTTATLNFGVPVTATLTQQLGARFRLSTDATLGANGAAPNGEVEDYLIRVDMFDLAIEKRPDVTLARPGELVTFTIVITNEGTLPAMNIRVTDTFTNAFQVPVGNALNTANGWTGTASPLVTTVAGPVNPGATATLKVVLRIDPAYRGSALTNVASVPPDTNPPGEPPDDDDPGVVPVKYFDLALRKVKSAPAGSVLPGGFVTFTFTISNQGTIDARNIVVTDYITGGFTFAPNNGWVGSGAQISTTIPGPLAAGTSTTKVLRLQVATNYYGSQLTNNAEISSADDDGNPATPPPTDVDSTPDTNPGNDGTPKDDVTNEDRKTNPNNDEDDHDPALVPVAQIRDLAIEKTPDVLQARPGELVTFTIVITNEGTSPVSNIRVTDTFTNAFQVPTPNALNTANGWTGTASPLVTTVAGPLNPGTTTTLKVVLRIDPAYRGSQLTNTASVPPDDNPPGEPPDDEDPGIVPVKYFDLALRKIAVNNAVEPGKLVTFTLEVHNQGTLPAYNVQVSDFFTSALTFVSAAPLNASWSTVSATQVNRTIAGPVAPGTMTTVQLVLQVPSTYTKTGIITNTAEISAADDDTNPANTPPTDVDSTPDTNPTNDGLVTDNIINNVNGDQDDHDPAPVLVTYNPTAVQIAKSDVQKSASGMAVSWQTESESDLAGFNLYRLVNGQMQRVNDAMIAAQKPGQTDGASYELTDEAAGGQNPLYMLEIISSDGSLGYVYLGTNAQILRVFIPVVLVKR